MLMGSILRVSLQLTILMKLIYSDFAASSETSRCRRRSTRRRFKTRSQFISSGSSKASRPRSWSSTNSSRGPRSWSGGFTLSSTDSRTSSSFIRTRRRQILSSISTSRSWWELRIENVLFYDGPAILSHSWPFWGMFNHSLPFSAILYRSLLFSTILGHPQPFSAVLCYFLPFPTIPYHFQPFSAILDQYQPSSVVISISFRVQFLTCLKNLEGWW